MKMKKVLSIVLVMAVLAALLAGCGDTSGTAGDSAGEGTTNINDKDSLVKTYGERFKFGVEIALEEPADDETVMRIVENAKAKYTGLPVWFTLNHNFTPKQREGAAAYIRASLK